MVDQVLGTSVIEIENIVGIDFGSLQDTAAFDYNGWGGVVANSAFIDLHNCIVLNAAAQGITIVGMGLNKVTDCKVFCDDDSVRGVYAGSSNNGISSTDYYFQTTDSDNNVFERCRVEKIYDSVSGRWPSRGAHGFTVSARDDLGQAAGGNQFLECTAIAVNGSIELRGYGVTGTIFEDFKGYRGTAPSSESKNIIGLYFGTRNNTFRRALISGSDTAVTGQGSATNPIPSQLGDGSAADNGVASSGNLFENCAFVNVKVGVDFSAYYDNSMTQYLKDNTFNHCTWIADPNLATIFVRNVRVGDNNHLKNSIIYGFDDLYYLNPATSAFDPDFTFDSCSFYGSFAPPSGTNIIAGDPAFVNGGPAIGASSQCIGKATATPSVNIDFWGMPRNTVHDMGAFEYGSTNPPLQPQP